MFNYTKHHKACTGNCGYCQQLRRENPGKSDEEIKNREEIKDESIFAWDEASVTL